MYGQLADWRSFWPLNVTENHNREALGIEVDLSLPTERVVRAPDNAIEWRGKPRTLRSHKGQKYIGHTLTQWAERRGIEHPTRQSAADTYIKRRNRTIHHDWLGRYLFEPIDETQEHTTTG